MRTFWHSGLFLSGAATVAFLAGCSLAGSQVPANAPISPLSQQVSTTQSLGVIGDASLHSVQSARGAQTIVSDSGKSTVSVFGADGRLLTRLSRGLRRPSGLTTDAAENLYVANTQKHNVLVYAQPYGTASLTLNDANEYPTGVSVSTTGVVGVTNLQSVAGSGGNVTFYAKGSTSPCATVSDPNWNGMYFGAFDASGNLFMDGIDQSGNPVVGEVSGGCSATSVSTLSVGNTLYNVGGVQVQNGNVLILDQVYNSFSPVIYTYAPPSGGSLGSPIATTKLSAGIEMVTFAFVKGGRSLWIAHSDAAAGRIKYTYPGGRFVTSFNEPGLMTAVGIAVNPVASP